MSKPTIRVRVKMSKSGLTYWRVTSVGNNKKIATAGEQFGTASVTRQSFERLANAIRAMDDDTFAIFMAGLREKITE